MKVALKITCNWRMEEETEREGGKGKRERRGGGGQCILGLRVTRREMQISGPGLTTFLADLHSSFCFGLFTTIKYNSVKIRK